MRSLKLYCDQLPGERLNHSVWVAINRFDPQVKGFSVSEIKKIPGVPNVVTIANDYRVVTAAQNEGKPLRQVMPATTILHDIDALAHALLGVEKHQQAYRHVHVFRRVIGALKR
jgi:Flp pilus assembly CpaE family ATPase